MKLSVQIEKKLVSGGRIFELDASFETSDNFTVLFGPSGSGKSLTLGCIAGMVVPDSGRIELNGTLFYEDEDTGAGIPIRRRGVGYLFQDYALMPHLSVEQNAGLGLRKWWKLRLTQEESARVALYLRMFELEGLAGVMPHELSGGQRQRVALARALVSGPELLLLDEPFASLDLSLRARMREELITLQKQFCIPVVMITHDPADVEAFGETLVEYDGGRCVRVSSYRQMRGMGAAGVKTEPVLIAGENK
ncbi:MAG TPA: ATP-binding cassette domain-containing protein [Nitrospirota bacterium]